MIGTDDLMMNIIKFRPREGFVHLLEKKNKRDSKLSETQNEYVSTNLKLTYLGPSITFL